MTRSHLTRTTWSTRAGTTPRPGGIQVRRNDELDEVAMLDLLRAVIANNRAGGWRKVRPSG